MIDRSVVAKVNQLHDYEFSRELSFELVDYDAGRSVGRCRFKVDSRFCNGFGFLHGGIVSAILDMTLTATALAATDVRSLFPTIEMKTSFLEPVPPGGLEGIGRVVKLGRTTAFLAAEVLGARGTALAAATATAAIRSNDEGAA